MEKQTNITLILADDHEMIREGFCSLFRGTPISILATAADGEELLQLVREHQPQVVVADIKMPKMNGIKASAIIKREFPQIKIMAFTGFDETELIKSMLEAGATGFALKNTKRDELFNGIKMMLEDKPFFCNNTAAKLMELDEPPKSPVDFTPREIEVIACISEGCSNRQISKRLGINVRTVETHRANIYKKMGVKTPVAAALFARKYGLV